MKPMWQMQQEQMREQQRQREMMHVYSEQQRAKAAQAQAQAPAAGKPLPPDDPFARVEAEAAKLREEFAANRVTEEQFNAGLRELMMQDEHGQWWMVGRLTGQWYRHDGHDWVQAVPPMHHPSPQLVPQSAPSPQLLPQRHPLRGVLVFLGLAAMTLYGMAVVSKLAHIGILVLAVGLLLGFVLSFKVAKRSWRGW